MPSRFVTGIQESNMNIITVMAYTAKYSRQASSSVLNGQYNSIDRGNECCEGINPFTSIYKKFGGYFRLLTGKRKMRVLNA